MSAYPRARSEGVVSEEVGDELVIYDEATQVAHSLSRDAASVWRLCDGHRSAEDVAYRVGLEQARVAQALDELSAAGLMQEPDGISRRALYKRAAKLGAATLSAPLIYSVAIRPTSAHASTPSTCSASFLGNSCTAFFGNAGCTGPSLFSSDTCTNGGAPAGCTCHPTVSCASVPVPNLFLGTGTCL